jgi:hypothetical protein
MNLHDVLYVWAGGPHFEEWAIDGRRLGAGQPSGNAATSFAQG